MAKVTLGVLGCLNADLVIAQGQRFTATIDHETSEGEPISHAGGTGYCRLQAQTATVYTSSVSSKANYVLDQYVTCGDSVVLDIPGTVTAKLPVGTYNWDLFVDEVRLVYGTAEVHDTYARDDVDGRRSSNH